MTVQSCILTGKKDISHSCYHTDYSSVFNFNNRSVKNYDWANELCLPISLFNNCYLSAFETIVKYLKEITGLSYREISKLLNRDERTIWGVYHNSRKKMQSDFKVGDQEPFIPILIFKDRSLSVLETITEYLKDKFNLRYCQIASSLNRDDRTIWTAYKRAKRKRDVAKNDLY